MVKRRMSTRLTPSRINNKVGKSRVGQKGGTLYPSHSWKEMPCAQNVIDCQAIIAQS